MSDLIRNPTEAGWYIGQPLLFSGNEGSVVVRVVPDPCGVTTVWKIGSRDPSTLDQWRLVAKVKIDGQVTDLDLKEAHADGVRQGREDARREQAEHEAKHDRENPTFAAWTTDVEFREVGEPTIAVHMTESHAEALSNGISDLLCWARGFSAALGADDSDRRPMGIDAIRTIRETITKAQRAADGAKAS